MRKWSKRIALGSVAIALGGMVVVWATSFRPQGPWLSVEFLGDPDTLGRPAFVISNRTDRPVKFTVWPAPTPDDEQWDFNLSDFPRITRYDNQVWAVTLAPHEGHAYRYYRKVGRPVRLMVVYLQPHTHREERRERWSHWLNHHKLRAPAKWIAPPPENRQFLLEEK